jgi:hypothetical protein
MKIADAGTGQLCSEKSGNEHQLVIVHPDEVVRTIDRFNRLREELVDGAVALKRGGLKLYRLSEMVAEGPQGGVRKSIVEKPFVFGGEIYRNEALR